MPNPRAQRPLSLQAVTEDIRSLAQPAQAMLDMLAGAAKGSVSATAGVGGDLESLARGIASAYRAPSGQRMDAFSQGLDQPTFLPTTADISAKLPDVVPQTAPLSRQHSAGYGQTMGEFIPTPGSGRVARGALNAVKSIPAALQHGATEFAKASAMGAPHVVKPKGGNWMKGMVEDVVNPLKTHRSYIPPAEQLRLLDKRYTPEQIAALPEDLKAHVELSYKHAKNQLALDNWIDRKLTNYIKNEMATEGDPIRKLAEQGIVHKSPESYDITQQGADRFRGMIGGQQMGKSDAAKAWENASDTYIEPIGIKEFNEGEFFQEMAEPWMAKAPKDTKIYNPQNEDMAWGLGFDHIIDVLKEDLTSGRIRPEQLSKVSMEQAVRRTYEYDQEMAKKMREAAIKQTEGMRVHKEYPEGYKWKIGRAHV